MTIQTINLAVPGGDTPRSANTKINANFSDQTHAASRLVGKENGQVPLIGQTGFADLGFGGVSMPAAPVALMGAGATGVRIGVYNSAGLAVSATGAPKTGHGALLHMRLDLSAVADLWIATNVGTPTAFIRSSTEGQTGGWIELYTKANTTKDANGFLKGASPVIDMYDNKIDLNHDAIAQGGITFEKLGVGDYLIKGSLGFAQEGWYIETPKDANGNVLVAVVYEQLANNDLSIKTYAKKFDDETGDIVANLLKPRDIPTGRFISLRLHELPVEPPVMPTQDTSADAPAQTNNP